MSKKTGLNPEQNDALWQIQRNTSDATYLVRAIGVTFVVTLLAAIFYHFILYEIHQSMPAVIIEFENPSEPHISCDQPHGAVEVVQGRF